MPFPCRHEGGDQPCILSKGKNRICLYKKRAYAKARRAIPGSKVERSLYVRWKKYGVQPSEFIAKYKAQDGCCAGCGQPLHISKAHLDHCHATKTFRGLVHRTCNVAMGMVKDSPETLTALAAYLRRHQSTLELAKYSNE